MRDQKFSDFLKYCLPLELVKPLYPKWITKIALSAIQRSQKEKT